MLNEYSYDYYIYLYASVNNFKAVRLYEKMKFISVSKTENYFKDRGVEPYTGIGCNAYVFLYKQKTRSFIRRVYSGFSKLF
jgi:ribosomal protein S18 acetylase RimI-like enzyme